MQSEYLKMLLLENRDVGERYQMKLKLINDVDPFTLTIQDLDDSIQGVPPITNMDIISYLVFTHSYYSKEQMRAYKSLQSYKFFESGFVVNAGTKMINNFYILVGKVKHSQRANANPLDVWCIITKDGSVSTAHCTCMAGHSEVCSHVGAILFLAEYANRRKPEVSCTDSLSTWTIPTVSEQVPLVPVSEMNWGKPSSSAHESRDIAPISTTDLNNILKKMSELGHDAVIARIVEPFATDIAKQVSITLPSVLNIFDESHTSKRHMELMQISKTIDISLNQQQITEIEKATRSQSENHNWYLQRAGRITASKLKAVYKTNKTKPSLSLIKSICYPTKTIFNNKATLWGLTHEHQAVEEYKRHMEEENHESFVVNEVGFIISKNCPQFGASPDRLVFCECCYGGCLEVKCPYMLRNADYILDLSAYAGIKGSCLIERDGRITLRKSHSYYYQVQMQIFVTQLRYCDFVVWSPSLFFKERIMPDFEFWEKVSEVAGKFHSEIIMPELLGRFFTRQEGSAAISYWCTCKGVDDGRPMIKCDGDDCETIWFHFECVGLVDTPNIAWYCQACNPNL